MRTPIRTSKNYCPRDATLTRNEQQKWTQQFDVPICGNSTQTFEQYYLDADITEMMGFRKPYWKQNWNQDPFTADDEVKLTKLIKYCKSLKMYESRHVFRGARTRAELSHSDP
eukprot:GHVO01000461.1.p1 GENE.GHVO01000461.1~~GHVO01000461.1.p1  ORF type:complete len:113 (+),score=6.24 GHVO01000461.1:544-882(+)